jgi:acetyl-CoA carboxylase biotin carboxylase subunit
MNVRPRPPFSKILVANRGEIAVRVIRACRELGIATVAVHSEADAAARHVRLADEAVSIGPPEPRESYLAITKIVDACRKTGAEAVHPGYGFLAENAAFARACAEAGVVFIGPSPGVIERMGEKTAARALMEKAGVPVVPGGALPPPGADGELDADAVRKAAERVGFPIMVKAAFGGGGKGMRLVHEPSEVAAAAAAAAREAASAFGDGTVYLERFLERPRHVEFQIFGDAHGNAVHLLERECSIQRRHQKIIEETPSTALTPELRERMGAAAVAAAHAVDYTGAGTVEFLLAEDGAFYFLEMNTRLQVEHPITELLTGLDLVRTQIAVAGGAPLPWRQEDIRGVGHAIECRIYAEDPARNFLPSLGPILLLHEPQGPGIRIDSGVRQGDEVSMHYDPMIAKLALQAGTRDDCIERALAALRDYAVLGVTTNVAYLLSILDHPAFRAGETHTGFLPEHLAGWAPAGGGVPEEDPELTAALVAAAVVESGNGGPRRAAGEGGHERAADAPSPWETLGRFRLGGLD